MILWSNHTYYSDYHILYGLSEERYLKSTTDDPVAMARYQFTEGVKLLQTPNRKTGEIDYKGAFDLFNQSAQVGQRPCFTTTQAMFRKLTI